MSDRRDPNDTMYGIAELARLGGVSRRTVRYYVQRGLLPAPTGTGRGKHYTQAHLDALVEVRELQAAGVSLAEIEQRTERVEPAQGDTDGAVALPGALSLVPEPATTASQAAWLRVVLDDDTELHLRRERALDSTTLTRLARAIRDVLDDTD